MKKVKLGMFLILLSVLAACSTSSKIDHGTQRKTASVEVDGNEMGNRVMAPTNMLMPVLHCKLSENDIEEMKKGGGYSPEGFTLLADFQNVIARSSGPGVLVFSGKSVGAVSEEPTKFFNIGSAQFGVFKGSSLADQGLGLKNGIIFKGDVVNYNHKHRNSHVLSLKVDKASKSIKAELKAEPKDSEEDGFIENYTCIRETLDN